MGMWFFASAAGNYVAGLIARATSSESSGISGEVYNLGGGKDNSCSIIEAFDICQEHSGKKQVYEYLEENRIGDHLCYYSDLSKIKAHYPDFKIEHSLSDTIMEIVQAHAGRV